LISATSFSTVATALVAVVVLGGCSTTDTPFVPREVAAATPIDPWLSADPATGLMQIAFAYRPRCVS